MRSFKRYLFPLLLLFTLYIPQVYGQIPAVTITLSVSDGIPQSYISGIVQDKQGFVWIASRDGLAKYDGRKFRIFRHEPQSPESLSDNIIISLYLDDTGKLWITFEQGAIDVLDTFTEKIVHFNTGTNSVLIKEATKTGRSIVHVGGDIYWALGVDGNIYVMNYKTRQVKLFRHQIILPGLAGSSITGIAASGKDIILVTSSSLVFMDTLRNIRKIVKYTFSNTGLYNPKRRHKDNSPFIRKNGQVVIHDEESLIVYDPLKDVFSVVALPWQQYYLVPPRVMDAAGNILFGYGGTIYKLDSVNNLSVQLREEADARIRHTSLLLDKSGVLWAGTNGFGIRQYDNYLKQMPQAAYKGFFQEDILALLGVSEQTLKNTFLADMDPYFFRWVHGKDGRIWFSKAGADVVIASNVALYDKGKLIVPDWTYRSEKKEVNYGIDALSVSKSGKLWGIDHAFRPVLFDTEKFTATVYGAIPHPFDSKKPYEINGFTIDKEEDLWISSSQGLLKFNVRTGQTSHFFHQGNFGSIMTLLQDPVDFDILWLGSSSHGLIRFNKKTKLARSFTIKDGLPNSTVYAILPDNQHKLWCSTNRGMFSFDLSDNKSRTYITQGEMAVHEFNRFHFFKFVEGKMAFGATEGFTVFDPKDLFEDAFEPHVALTGLKINNKAADFGQPGTDLTQSVNSITELLLPYNKNFLAFEFAALQFNIPEKLQYRYKLKGLDNEWVMAGADNTATYTTIPPGKYILEINGSNTAGKWSRYVKSLNIIIQPPFWSTWWFIATCILLSIGTLYFTIKKRIENIRKKAEEKIVFERKAMELEAQALRAQMNPHFIFNCLNSIKALIQEDEKIKAVTYLTTFSKLMRSQLLNNQHEITLSQELDTCKSYLALEALRFGKKLTYEFVVDEMINLHAIMVPPMILQPFVENGIIHGILPLERNGHIVVMVGQQAGRVICHVDDNGMGREKSREDRILRNHEHISKGTLLAEDRVKIHNTLYHNNFQIKIEDKKDTDNNPVGTRVTLEINSTL